jgi:hypothetical protein
VLATPRHLGLTLLDRHELIREVALADEHVTCRHADLLGEGRDLGELLVRDVREQRDRLQAAWVHAFS